MRTFQDFSDGLFIFSKYCDKGMNTQFMVGAEHDEIYIYVSQEDLQPESEDGKRLQDLGFQPHDGGNWVYYP